jgi:hypothetical protein
MDIMVKLERDAQKISFAKDLLMECIIDLKKHVGLSTIEVLIDVEKGNVIYFGYSDITNT